MKNYLEIRHLRCINFYLGDAQTLALTSEGVVYSWGDGDYGKLGRGGSDGSGIPRLLLHFILHS